jgi:spectinomycin phosphotransferase
MRQEPNVESGKLCAILEAQYGISLRALEFLPLGNDARSWSYRAVAENGALYFVKLRQLPLDGAALTLTRLLLARGIEQVVAPIPAKNGALWQPISPFGLILYPFIEGICGMEAGLTLCQWATFGKVMKQIHFAILPAKISQGLAVESFHLRWGETGHRVQARISEGHFSKPSEAQFAAYWQVNKARIKRVFDCAAAIGQRLQQAPPPFCLCHADIHTANLIVDPRGELHIVDWDGPILAPKERDLMFIMDGTTAETDAFFSGYGRTAIDSLALAYYRCEWVVQELGDYGARIFFRPDLGEPGAEESLDMFIELFNPGDVVDTAEEALDALE